MIFVMDITVVHPWGESPPPNSPFDICFADSEMLETLLPFQLGRYRLESLIGQGGMARVFRAVLLGPAGFEKTVAIKLMTMVRTDKASADFRREAVYASRIHHPNVVDVMNSATPGLSIYRHGMGRWRVTPSLTPDPWSPPAPPRWI